AMAGRELTITPTKRERRKSPAMSFTSDSSSVQPPPMSPTSSVADTTFEPTIDMMVNDFDDEATLNEEEALADQEAHNPEDEIATLREESEMPIEELLAKYSSMPTTSPVATSSFKRSSGSSRRRRAPKRQHQESDSAANVPTSTGADEVSNEPITTATGQEAGSSVVQTDDDTMTADDCTTLPGKSCNDVDAGHQEIPDVLPPEVSKKHRSHLLDLYPGETFPNSAQQTLHAMEDLKSFTPLQTLFDEVEEEEEEDESDTESDDARKIIMVGPDYQADIPEGLSQYGDILPYENEDQLIWEPSQVTEREVEDYLAKIQETRALTTSSTDEAAVAVADMAEVEENTTAVTEDAAAIATPATVATANPTTANLDSESVVKDNEQALHLLVQCGYDFKEALRRKRLNVLPLSDTMSSWSEEECQKFEEGIHKFGKDFYQIRQNQVRTRTMRELVQFYYLWKKSERRDQSFALNDTIDHMDVFLNEGGNGNITSNVATAAGVGNGNGNGNGSCSSQASSCSSSNGHSNANVNNEASALDKEAAATVSRKSTTKNYSIMTGGQPGGGGGNASATSRKRGASFALDNEDNEQDAENVTI
ncbi:hypothetical protein KR215_011288, partial [Drosophila sulfurigaster]